MINDYWTKGYLLGYRRPPNDHWHPKMPTRKLCHALGTIWYQLTEDCCIQWMHNRYDYPKGWIVYEKRSKPIGHVNYKWILAQKGYDENNVRGWINDTNYN